MPDPFTDEDRARLEAQASKQYERQATFTYTDAKSLTRALAYIDHLEGALREIAKTSCFGTARGADSVEWRDHQKIARAALPTSKED